MKQQEDRVPQGKWGERQRNFNKRFGRNDAKYLRDAVSNFCEETRRMYSDLLSPDYVETPLHSPYFYCISVMCSREGDSSIPHITPITPGPISPDTQKKVTSQPIEDRIHSFTDALMTEIHKHKAWRGVNEEGMRSRGV